MAAGRTRSPSSYGESSSVDTVAGYLCWGDATVTTYQGTTAAWPSEYIARWAVPNGSSLTTADSTANAHDGTVTGGVTAAAGQLDGAAAFNGSTGYITASSFTALGNDLATWSCWINPHTTGGPLLVMGAIDSNAPYISRNSDNTIWSGAAPAANPIKTIETIPLDAWTMVTMVSPNGTGTQKVYINGTEATYSDLGGGGVGLGPVTSLHIGAYFDNSLKWNGSLDECLWTNDNKTAAWVAAKYANESAPYDYYTFGSDTPVGGVRHRVIGQ